MVGARPSVRRIERASTLLVGLLASQGALPRVPQDVADRASRLNAVPPTYELAAALTYFIAWEREKAVGMVAYLDRFDYHTMRPVRDIATISGSRRAVIDLLKSVCEAAREDGRMVIGAIEPENEKLAAVLKIFGRRTRVVWESV